MAQVRQQGADGDDGGDRRHVELTALGLDADTAQAWLQAQGVDPDVDGPGSGAPDLAVSTPVWPENWPVLCLFLRLQTQWRRRPDGSLQGLRYGEVESTMRLMRLKDKPRLFDQLVDMEHAALEAWDG